MRKLLGWFESFAIGQLAAMGVSEECPAQHVAVVVNVMPLGWKGPPQGSSKALSPIRMHWTASLPSLKVLMMTLEGHFDLDGACPIPARQGFQLLLSKSQPYV